MRRIRIFSVTKRSKQTVSELKRLAILEQQADEDLFMENGDEVSTAYLHNRPEFMQTRALSAGGSWNGDAYDYATYRYP